MMPPKGREHCQRLPPDPLSDLPDNVIDVILMCLPCKDAVRTSVLSRKWRYLWCRLTELMLDESHWSTEEDLLDPTVKFTKIIYQFVTLHQGPITKFTLDIPELRSCPEIDFFIYVLSRNGIQHLFLHLPYNSKLPSSLFTCSQLRHLILHDCLIHPPSVFTGFDRLVSLELRNPTISSELLEILIAHCPLLEQLNISGIFDIIKINAPMLRSFEFTGNISCICLKNVPLLVKASLECYDNVENLDFAKVFESCSSLEHLLLDLSNTEIFAEEGYALPTMLPFDLNSVKRFYLREIMLVKSYGLCLTRSFPYLEYLEIEDCDDIGTEESLELKHLSNVTFNHLRKVKLGRFSGMTSDMQLIKLLLANSPVLERMLINRRYLDHEPLDTRLQKFADTRLQIFAEISNFLRASPKAEVVYEAIK